MEAIFWNQTNLKLPATSAHQIKITSKECRSTFEHFAAFLKKQGTDFLTILDLLKSETVVLKQFLYKLSAVFRQDKSIKILKLILKCVNKFIDMKLNLIFSHMTEQHCLGNTIHVSPKPTYEFALVQFQGAVRLLAQILCYCQHCVRGTTPRMHQGHFINISVISYSLISRIWASSLHLLKLLIQQFSETKRIYDSDYLPKSSAKFLPENYIIPSNLENWLLADSTLNDIHRIIMSPKEEPKAPEQLLESIQADQVDSDELSDLIELRDLVTKSSQSIDASATLNRKRDLDEPCFSVPVKQVDLGELVRRNDTIPMKNKKQRRRKKNRK